MFFSSVNTFYDAIKPILWLNCHSGLGALRLPNQSETSYFYQQLYTVVAALINWISIYFAATFIIAISGSPDSSPMAIFMYQAIVAVNSCITVIAPILVWLRRKGLKECLRRMLILDETFEAVLGARNEYRKDCIRFTCHAIAVVLVIFIVTIYDVTWSLDFSQSLVTSFCIALTLHHPIFVMLVLDLNFCSFVGYLGKKFRDLNNALLKLAERHDSISNPPGKRLFKISENMPKKIAPYRDRITNAETKNLTKYKRDLLEEIRKAHLELCKLTRQVNAVFGIQNLLSAGLSFGMITGLLYTVYSSLEWQDLESSLFRDIIPSILWAVIYIFKIWMISHSCWSVGNEAQRTGEVIYELLTLKGDQELQRDQIQVFALQMLQNSVRFDACGFFTIDYTFVQGVIGSITTYLVILIQMSHISEPADTAFDQFNNDTEI